MRNISRLIPGAIAVAITLLSLAHAGDRPDDPSGLWKSLQGATYKFHSGIVADHEPPTAKDSRLTIVLHGKAAKELFESIGPDQKETCDDVTGDRERAKKGVSCTYTASLVNDKDGPVKCWIGLDLKTGDTIGTISC
jgi:hypothetical protein